MFGMGFSIEVWGLILGILGLFGSVVGVFYRPETTHVRIIHACYGVVLLFTALLFADIVVNDRRKLADANASVARSRSIGAQAGALFNSYDRRYSVNCRGVIFASFAFLEKFKSELPETFQVAKRFAERASEPGRDQIGTSQQERDCTEGSYAMQELLRGLAAN